MENLIKPFKQMVSIESPPSNGDGESNEDIDIKEDISIDSDTDSNDELGTENDREFDE